MPEESSTNQLFLMLGRIEAKLDSYASKHDDLAKEFDNIKTRLNVLEADKNKTTGVLSTVRVGLIALGTVVGMFASQIIELFIGK